MEWISVKDRLPQNDELRVVWVQNEVKFIWSKFNIASFMNGKWYCMGGRTIEEIVTHWKEESLTPPIAYYHCIECGIKSENPYCEDCITK